MSLMLTLARVGLSQQHSGGRGLMDDHDDNKGEEMTDLCVFVCQPSGCFLVVLFVSLCMAGGEEGGRATAA